jgi:hypothetical protein
VECRPCVEEARRYVTAGFFALRAKRADLVGSQVERRFRLSKDPTGSYAIGQQRHVPVTEKL